MWWGKLSPWKRTMLQAAALVIVALILISAAEPTRLATGIPRQDREIAVRMPMPVQTTYDFSTLTEFVVGAVARLPVQGVSLLLLQGDQVIYEHAFGSYTLDQTVAIASASKWLAAATILGLVDDGLLSLDDPVAKYIPDCVEGDRITIRQLLSHTSGLSDLPACLDYPGMSLADCAGEVARAGLAAEPGTQLSYATGPFQVAGRIAEIVTGKPWAQVFAERIARPLQMTGTTYGDVTNPNVGGGAVSTLNDYGNFLSMLMQGGTFDSQRVLSEESVREMETNQTGDLPITLSVHQDGRRYGLGAWIDRTDAQGRAVQLSSQGDTGFSPWIDRQREIGGVLLTDAGLGSVYGLVEQIQQKVRDIVDAHG